MESPRFPRTSMKRKSSESDFNINKRTCIRLILPDLIQENIRSKFASSGIHTISSKHSKQWPINMQPLDGLISPPQSPCPKCLAGQSGHWKHVQ